MQSEAAAWWLIAIGLSPLAGFLVARASVQLPRDGPTAPSRRRSGLAIAACLAAAGWAALLTSGPLALVSALLGWQLVLIALLDAEHFWLPHRLTVPLGLMGLAEAAAFEAAQLADRLIGAAAGFAVLAGVAWAYRRVRGREGIGGGDFRLFAAAGAWVGWQGLPSVLVLAAGAGLVLAGLRAARGRKLSGGDAAPFGVYLAAGLWLTWLYGPIGRAGL